MFVAQSRWKLQNIHTGFKGLFPKGSKTRPELPAEGCQKNFRKQIWKSLTVWQPVWLIYQFICLNIFQDSTSNALEERQVRQKQHVRYSALYFVQIRVCHRILWNWNIWSNLRTENVGVFPQFPQFKVHLFFLVTLPWLNKRLFSFNCQ